MPEYKDLLLSPPPSRDEIMRAIMDKNWQDLRIDMKGISTEAKLKAVRSFLRKRQDRTAKVVVHNYINALKRGGQLK